MNMNESQMRILVVDDDAVSRELLALLLAGEGYEVETADSGDAALLHLGSMMVPRPRVVLTDMQMPGTSGDSLADRLRSVCGEATVLLAMSGSVPDQAAWRGFDGFLRKPFKMETLRAAIAGSMDRMDESHPDIAVLDEQVYQKLTASMPRDRLTQLYELCLSDAAIRIAKMRQAASEGDSVAYRKEAHAIRGGCGMVGATELQILATSMEDRPLSNTNHVASLDEFMTACERLRRILDVRASEETASKLPGEDVQ